MKEPIPILASSPTCGACKTIKKALFDIDAIYLERSIIDHPEYFAENNIKKLPTLDTQQGVFITGAENIIEYFKIQTEK